MAQRNSPVFSDIKWCEDFSSPFSSIEPFGRLLNPSLIERWAIILPGNHGLSVEHGEPSVPKEIESLWSDLRWELQPELGWVGVSPSASDNDKRSFLQLLLPLVAAGSDSSDDDVLALADTLPFLVSCIDASLRYEFVNQLYVDLYDRPRDVFYQMTVPEAIGDAQYQQVKPLIERALAGEKVDQQVAIRIPQDDGTEHERFLDCVFTPRYEAGLVTGVYVCVHDQTSVKRTTLALQRLHSITARDDFSLTNKIQRLLELGCELFHLPFGIVSHVVGDNYSVAYCHSPDGEISPGAEFALGDCYCVHTLERKEVTGFFHAGTSEIATHPCYQQFKLEAYLGVAIIVEGEVWGTLNFSSPYARTKDFSDDEYELIKLFAQWIGAELTRARHDDTLTNAEKRHRLILESVHDGILGVDGRCHITFVNSAASKMTGYRAEELIGQHICVLMKAPEQRFVSVAGERCIVSSSISSGERVAVEDAEFFDKSGGSFAVKFAISPIDDGPSSDDLGAVLTFQDITEQQAFQSALTKQMELFRSLFMDAPEAIVVVDQQRIMQMANPHALAMFGYEESDVVGKSPEFLYADKSSFEEVGLAYAAANSPERSEYKMVYRRADGSTFVTENVRSKIVDDEGALRGFIIHARDITSRLAIEADIEKARNRLSIATLSAGIGVWEMDVNSLDLVWDEQMVAIYGIDVPVGVPFDYECWVNLVHPDDVVKLQSAADRSVETGQDLDVDFRINLPSGEERHIKANARIGYDGSGKPSYFLGVNYDITERYRTEAILKRAREEAIQASQAKSNFLATMSHEIRTPLNGVLGMAEILATSELSERQQYQLDVIRNSGENLLELINEILDFSKIEAGHLSLELIDFDLEKLVFDLARLLVVKAEAKSVDLLVQYDLDGISIVNGDAYRIRQILTNLVGNAIKFTEQGEIIITVTGSKNPETQCLDVDISVSDTGIGIAPHAQANLFQAFTQADNSTTRKFGGTGLGLAITKQLVDLMGGEVSLTSELGVGTTFRVSLSLSQSEGPLKVQSYSDEFSFSRVLVVDDNETNLSILQSQLEQCHLTAEYESSSLSAVERVIDAAEQARPYDLIILDYLMPGMDGLETSRQIRVRLESKLWPKVLMISSAGALHSSELRGAGVQVCINKPTSVHELTLGLKAVGNVSGPAVIVSPDERINVERNSGLGLPSLEGRTILVVEDMQANLAVAQGMLAQLGVEVVTAEDGKQGVEKWLDVQPDLILMDLHMPVMDGLTAIKTIRSMEGNTENRVPILALTADIQPERMLDVEAAGGDGYISKPFKRKELLETITNRLFNKELKEKPTKSEVDLLENDSKQSSIDESVLGGLEEILGDQVNEIVLAFIHDAKNVFQMFHEAVSQGASLTELQRPAHSLKSVSANVGALRLSELAAQLEKDCHEGKSFDATSRVEEIWQEFERVCDHLRRLGRLI